MQQGSFFDVTPTELDQLGSELAVAVLRQMLWAEVANLGIPISQTDIPFAVTTSDGGIDAIVKTAPKSPGNGLIFSPITSYQVKTGGFSVSATTPSKIEELLITPSAIDKRKKLDTPIVGSSYKADEMNPRVRACLDANGTFVVMLFGNDGIDTEEDATEKAIQKFLSEINPAYKNAKIKVWRQSRICGILRPFPAICLQIKNLSSFPLLNHERWSERREMQPHYEQGSDQKVAIASLQSSLRDDSQGHIHIRLIGEPGIGKTRLILEALRSNDLAPLVLYAEKASQIDGQVVAALNASKHARIILVVDECDPEQRSSLIRTFGDRGAAIKVVSIYQDISDSDGAPEYRFQRVPPLPDVEIETILGTYGVDISERKSWAELCEGSPRVAHVIGQNLRDHPDEPLKSDGVSEIWVRFLAADVSPKSEDYRRRHLVLSSLALFKRFGWGPAVRDEGARQIYDLIVSELDKNISLAQYTDIISQMAGRKVLQGDNFLYITPKALHIKLWIDWWTRYGANINVNKLIPQLNTTNQEWFGEMLEYANATPISKSVVADLLGPEGLYKDAEWLKTKEGGRFFFSLSLADPPSALRLLERTIGEMKHEELLKFDKGRREVIWALENMALYSDLFISAAKLLLRLGDAENETWSNNASGIFAGLFSLGYGEVAPTSLSPEYRLPILIDALDQGGSIANLALKAFDASFDIQSISRWGGDQPFRLNERVKRWLPKTNGEWFGAYRLYWTSLRAHLQKLPTDLKLRAAKIMLSHLRGLFRVEVLRGELLDTLTEFTKLPELDHREIIEAISRILKYDAKDMPGSASTALKRIRDGLVGSSFGSQLKRYAGMDLLEDRFDGEKEVDRTAKDIQRLALQALNEPETLSKELGWLVTNEAQNGYRFGYTLSELDEKNSLWPIIYKAWEDAGEKAHDYFIGGYLGAIFKRNPSQWEKIIREIAQTSRIVENLAVIVWRSGITDSIADLLLDLVKNEKIDPGSLRIFSMGKASAPISDEVFNRWLTFLVEANTFRSASTALDLAAMSMIGGRKLPTNIIEAIITHPAIFARQESRADVMLTHYWLQMARTLIKQKPSANILVLKILIENIGNSGAVTAQLGPEGETYLDGLIAEHAKEAWEIIAPLIAIPMDARGFAITRWLRGDNGFGRNPGPMRHIPHDAIWNWVKGDPDKRAAFLATMAPKDFEPSSWKSSLIREILCKFGGSKLVQSAVHSNFFTGGWSGPASAHYAEELAHLQSMKKEEDNPNALKWLNDAINATNNNMQRAKIEEEARGY